MATRKTLSKKLRFDVFERDNFTCRYCGKVPPDVKLEVDHIRPVVEGGENEEANLITSCDACNRGKGKRLLKNGSTDANDRRRAQEYLEQLDLSKVAYKAIMARTKLRQVIVNHVCGSYGVKDINKQTISFIMGLL